MYREGICNPNVLEAKAIYFTEICEGVCRQLQIIQDGIFSSTEKVHKCCFPSFASGCLVYHVRKLSKIIKYNLN